MRRQMVDRALAGLDTLESMHRYAMAGGSGGAPGGGSPITSPRPTGSDILAESAASVVEGGEEDYQYVPTKVCLCVQRRGWQTASLVPRGRALGSKEVG